MVDIKNSMITRLCANDCRYHHMSLLRSLIVSKEKGVMHTLEHSAGVRPSDFIQGLPVVGGHIDFTLNKVLCANDCRYGGFQCGVKRM